MVIFKFLGEIKIELNGIDIRKKISSKGTAILAILMMQKNKRINRRDLLRLLWPDSSEDAAKYNLRYNLWQLKKVINQTEEPFLMVSKDFCWMNDRVAYQCDFCQISEKEIAEIHNVDELEQILRLFSGDFFENQYFAGCDEFEETIIMQRYYLENKKLILLKRLIALYGELGESDKCLQAIMDCEEMDPYDQNNAEKRMEILFAKGGYATAIKFYQGYYNKLTRDLGIEPSERLKDLAGKMKNEKEMIGDHFSVNTRGVESIDCYWMADFIQQLLQCPGFRIADYLSKERIQDLSYIQYRLGECLTQPPMVRVLQCFVELVINICEKGKKLEIWIEDPSRIDVISKEAIMLLEEKQEQNLTIKKGQ